MERPGLLLDYKMSQRGERAQPARLVVILTYARL